MTDSTESSDSSDGADRRDFDLVLVGATGFVGRLTAQHLARSAPVGLRIGLAGRSGDRLTQVRATLAGPGRDWQLITVDLTDLAAVRELAARTRVVVTTVGPYLRHGLPLVEACAAAGTHYADLTGETLFVSRSIAAAHDLAKQSGARIVHSCGFDSIPSDLGVGLTAARARADGQGTLGQTVLHVRSLRAGISGGSIDSLRQQSIQVGADPALRKVVSDPRCLTGVDGAADGPGAAATAKPSRSRRTVISREARTGHWQTPFVMGAFNAQIVLRTDALAGGAYGPDFRFHEVIDTGAGPLGVVSAAGLAAGSAGLMLGMGLPPVRGLLDRVLPKPGEGPSEKTLRRGRFRVEIEAESTGGPRYVTRIGADLDPGYVGTAVMLGESGLSLATDDLSSPGGVQTPMAAMGEALAVRLREHEFTVVTERLAE